MRNARLSKSRIISGIQCPKRLFLSVHSPELAVDGQQVAAALAAGHEVGEIARSLHPGGRLISPDGDLGAALTETREEFESGLNQPLYEATFEHDGVLVRADIIESGDEGVSLIEVKSSTEVKDTHILDCAIQNWVIEGAGHRVERVQLAHIDNSFTYEGSGDYSGLLRYEDITDKVRLLASGVGAWANKSRNVLAGDLPEIAMDDHCRKPYACPFLKYCTPPQPDYPVTTLPRGKTIAKKLLTEGIKDIREIPEDYLTNDTHKWIREVVISGKPCLNPEAGKIVEKLAYPRYYLDFETITFGVPRWPGTRPYQQVPFQWSCHIESETGEMSHHEFLDVTGDAPMRGFAESLIEVLGTEGPILVYNASFENRIMATLGEMFPDLAEQMQRFIDRVVDLLPIAREYYYHPAMHGSWSIKNVLPTVAPDLDYAQLQEVKNGAEAQVAYLEAISESLDQESRNSLEQNMLKYCELDTLAMVKIAEYFLNGSSDG